MSGCDGNPDGVELWLEGRAGKGSGRAGPGGGGDVGGVVAGALVLTAGSCPVGEVERETGLPFAGVAFLAAALTASALDGAGLAAGRSEAGRAPTPWRYASAMASPSGRRSQKGCSA